MIAFLKGKVDFKSDSFVIIDVNNVGYKVFMPEKDIAEIEDDKITKIFTYMRVTQDDVSLYGFLTNDELAMFELLLTVGGIGAKSAIAILSNIEPSQFALAIITNDISMLKKLPGIGPKTAQRIVLELQDKIKSNDAIKADSEVKNAVKFNQNAKDAIDALQVLGYTRRDVEDVVSKMKIDNMSVEDIIKEGLKRL